MSILRASSTCRGAVARATLVALAAAASLAVAAPAAAAPDGAKLYAAKCVGCHGADGSGNTPMGKSLKAGDLRSAPVQSQTGAQLQTTVAAGKGKMQAFGKRMSPEEIAAVVGYLRGFKAKS